MSRILKRPMFRRGGSTNTGIMSGIVDRTKHQENPFPGSTIDREAIEGNTAVLESILRQYTPKARFDYGQVGLGLAEGKPLVEALKEPYGRFVKRDDAREAAIRGGASKLAISKALESPKIGTLKQVRNTSNQTLYGIEPGKTGFVTSKQILSVPGVFVPIDNRMGFRFNADTNTFEQIPISDIDREKDNKTKATSIGTQYNILGQFIGDMKKRLPGTVTGPTGSIFGFVEGSADQFAQIAESLGVKDGLVIENDGAIDKYLEEKGFTEKASSYATMKGSVINLGYALAKIAEPDNPRLSEGDIIRQLNRINFGSSREVFSNSLDQILKEEGIRASAEIKGLGFDKPDIFFDVGKESTEKGKKKIKKDLEKSGDIFDLGL